MRGERGRGGKGGDAEVVVVMGEVEFRVELESLTHSYAVITLCPLLDPNTSMSSTSRGYALCQVEEVRTTPRSPNL